MTHACVTVFWRNISPRGLLEYSATPVTSVVVSSYTAGRRRRPHISAWSFCSARDNSSGKGCEEVFFISMVSSSHIVYSLQKDLEQRSLGWFDKGAIISSHHWGEISHLHCYVFVPLQRFDACSSCSPLDEKETALNIFRNRCPSLRFLRVYKLSLLANFNQYGFSVCLWLSPSSTKYKSYEYDHAEQCFVDLCLCDVHFSVYFACFKSRICVSMAWFQVPCLQKIKIKMSK